MLTKAELSAIRERADAATPEPWRWIASRAGTYLASRPPRGWFVIFDCVRYGMQSATVRFRDQATDILHKDFTDSHDATFIAAARADVPALLAHIEELERDRSRLEDNEDALADSFIAFEKRIAELEAKLQRALDYAKCAEACKDYEGPVRWRWKDMVELLAQNHLGRKNNG